MPSLFLDPFIFACPPLSDGPQAFRDFISNLLSWQELRDYSWASTYISKNTCEILAETNSYPLWDDLNSAINTFGIDDVQSKDINEIVTSFLGKTSVMEDEFGIIEVLYAEFQCNPKNHLTQRPSQFVEGYKRLLVCIALIKQFGTNQMEHPMVLTKGIDANTINANMNANVVDFEGLPIINNFDFPISTFLEYGLATDTAGVLSVIDPAQIWRQCLRNDDCISVVKVFLFQHSSFSIENLSFSFHPDFISSAKELGFFGEEKKIKLLLQAILETILKISLRSTHHLRTGSGGNDPQILRGSDKAWRKDIDYDYHLHYWETQFGPQFANVVIHSEMKISS